jgi:PAS domain S-box-containing protein
MARKPTYEELKQKVKELEKEASERKKAEDIGRDITECKQVEEVLRESEAFSSSLLNNSPTPIILINQDTSVRYVNPALEGLTGFSASEIIGVKAPYPWWTEETLRKTTRDLKKSINKGAQRLEELFQKKSGERFYVEITSRLIKENGQFNPHCAVSIVSDFQSSHRSELSKINDKTYETLREKISFLYTRA